MPLEVTGETEVVLGEEPQIVNSARVMNCQEMTEEELYSKLVV